MSENTANKLYDAVIYGSGLRAFSAAMTLSEQNRQVLLLVPGGFVGSEITSSLHNHIQTGISKNADILYRNLQDSGAAKDHICDTAVALVRMLRFLEKADILFYANIAGVIEKNSMLKGLVVAAKNGIFAVEAKTFIDASDSLAVFNYIDKDIRVEMPENGNRICSFMLESFPPVEFPAKELPGKIRILPTCWEAEHVVEMNGKNRLDIPEVLAKIKKDFPIFRDSALSRASFTPLNLSPARLKGKISVKNLFACSEPAEFSYDRMQEFSATRMLEGEKLAESALAALPGIVHEPVAAEEVCIRLNETDDRPCDVLVCGGGTAGALAAISAARMGASVTIWESMDYLGGIGTGGAIHGYYYGTPGGLQDEIDIKAGELTKLFLGRHITYGFHPVAKMIVLEQLALDAGVRIEFGQNICGVETSVIDDPSLPVPRGVTPMRRLDAVNACSESGVKRSVAKTFIDSTGDADIAVFAGADYTCGREYDGLQHIFSVPAVHFSIDKEKDADGVPTGNERMRMIPYNIDAGYCDATDPWDVSRARREGLLAFDDKTFYPGGRVLVFSAVLGPRASRQIQGDLRITLSDQIRCAEFPDVIGYASAHYDNHAADYENESQNAMLWCWALDSYLEPIGCEIPYRTMLPAGIENLLVACRSLSLEYDAHLQFRMQRDMQRIGEAAGIAAALAVKEGVYPRHIDIPALQKELSKTRALLGEPGNYHSDEWKPKSFYPNRRLVELSGNDFRIADKLLPEANGKSELAALRSELDSESPEISYSAALKLATAEKNPKALDMLVKCIDEHCEVYPPKSWRFRSAPFWKIAIGVLGANEYAPARKSLENILKDEALQDQQAMILTVRALAHIGNKDSIPVLENLLKRKDLPQTQEFPHWFGSGKTITDNSLWKLELAVFETLHALGKDELPILEKYLKDKRLYVRNAANCVKERTGF